MIDESTIPYGAGIKYSLSLAAQGFSMEDDDFSITLSGSNGSVTIPKSSCIQDEKGNWYFVMDTTALGSGLVKIRVVAYVVDYDFASGVREELWGDTLCRIGRPMGCGMS